MIQGKLWKPHGASKPLPKQRAEAAQRDAVIARVILEDRERYAGLQVEWAERVMAKVKQNME